jgi:high-affinity Fe2+/Pb2+ permease
VNVRDVYRSVLMGLVIGLCAGWLIYWFAILVMAMLDWMQ